jgi:predicted acylesterase/phospholipase RssA
MDNQLLKQQMIAIGEGYITEVKDRVGTNKQFSDVIIPQKIGQPELQFVNLVQEGGGVWGIALVGYTYVLEGMGIRFLKLAGTSAGAINTMVMAAVGEREEAKSSKILDYLVDKPFSELIDGHQIAKIFIKWFIFQKNPEKQITNSLIYIVLSSIGFMFLGSLLMWSRPNGILSLEIWLVITGFIFWFGYDIYLMSNKKPSPETNPPTPTNNLSPRHESDVNNRIIKFIGSLMGVLAIVYFISLYSTHCNNFQTWFDILLVFFFFVFSFSTCFQRESFVFAIQVVGSFVSFMVLLIAILHLQGIYVVERAINTHAPPIAQTAYLHISSLGISLFIMLIAYFGGLVFFLYKRFQESRFGVNPGINFREWINDIMVENKAETLASLKAKFNKTDDNIVHRNAEQGISDLLSYGDEDDPAVCLITGEIYTNTKIEFPKMAGMFWENPDDVPLADFVRASMSIPIFFETFRRLPNEIPKSDKSKKLRRDYMMVGELNDSNLIDIEKHKGFAFMDGGIISNFPINKFFKPVAKPRLPTFGVMLNDPYKTPSDSLLDIIGSVFNTSRKHYDRSFLAEHIFYKQCLTNIDVSDINWLNFELEDKEKIALFKAGAEAAKEFLIKFCWCKYKKERNDWVDNFLNRDTKTKQQYDNNFQNCNTDGCIYAANCGCNDVPQNERKTTE